MSLKAKIEKRNQDKTVANSTHVPGHIFSAGQS
jgi:hypothetical protein